MLRKIISETIHSYLKTHGLLEDVFVNKADRNSKQTFLTYNKRNQNSPRINAGNLNSFDMLKTDKMDNVLSNDTYQKKLKCGLTAFNITSIKGHEVMHYFKRKFNNQKTSIKIGKEEYDLLLADDQFRTFLETFKQKVAYVVNYWKSMYEKTNMEENHFAFDKILIYPVPSSSGFNKTMAQTMVHSTSASVAVSIIDSSLLKKDFTKLTVDDKFIRDNEEYYNSPLNDKFKNKTHIDHINRYKNKMEALSKLKERIDVANDCVSRLISKYYTITTKKDGVLGEKFIDKLYELYKDYLAACDDLHKQDIKYLDTLDDVERKMYFKGFVQPIKYTKGPSVDKRSEGIFKLLNQYGKLPIKRGRKVIVPIQYYQLKDGEIKNIPNDVRMAFKDYFSIDDEQKVKLTDDLSHTLVVVFDDNLSGGATLNDICVKLEKVGFKYIIPITFGEMPIKNGAGTITFNAPPNGKFAHESKKISKIIKESLHNLLESHYNDFDIDFVEEITFSKEFMGDEEEDDWNDIDLWQFDIACYDINGEECLTKYGIDYEDLVNTVGEENAQYIWNSETEDGRFWNDAKGTTPSDINNVNEVNAIAKKCFTVSEYYPNERGYILTDGSFIYFGPNVDHASISRIDGMTVGKFVSLGNIRVGQGSLELEKPPTYEQKIQLYKLIGGAEEDIYVDIVKYSGKGQYSSMLDGCRFPAGSDPRNVLNQIQRFFNEGIKMSSYDLDESRKINKIIKECLHNLLEVKCTIPEISCAWREYVNSRETEDASDSSFDIDNIHKIVFDKIYDDDYEDYMWFVACYNATDDTFYIITDRWDDALTQEFVENDLKDYVGTENANFILNYQGTIGQIILRDESAHETPITDYHVDCPNVNIDEFLEATKNHFPITEYTGIEHGYILPDGTFLNFGEGIYMRDHIEINEVETEDGTTLTVGQFVGLCGAIRVNPSNFELAQKPTYEQKVELYKLIGNNPDNRLYVDITRPSKDGYNSGSVVTQGVYSSETPPKYVLNRISRYFNEGIRLEENLNRYNKIISETVHKLLMEIASPIVWHFTTVEAAISILENDEFVLSNTDDPDMPWKDQNEKLTGYSEKRPYYFSTTRSKSVYDGYSWNLARQDNMNGLGGVRIQLNGDLLNNTLHAKAANYHGRDNMKNGSSDKGYEADMYANKQASIKNYKTDRIGSSNEKEDTFWSTKPTIPNAIKYIQRIDILVQRYSEEIKQLEELCEEYGIPCHLYDDTDAYSIQSKKGFDEDSLFNKRLQQALKYFDDGYSPYTCFDNIEELPNGMHIYELQGRYNIFAPNAEFVNKEWSDDYDKIISQAEMLNYEDYE